MVKQDVEKHRRQFQAMLQVAEAEADREGTVTIESVIAEVDGIIGACGLCPYPSSNP